MELRAVSMWLLVVCAIIIITTEVFPAGRVPNCCTKTMDNIHWNILKKAKKYKIQSDAGPCELKALILFVGRKKYCFNSKTEMAVKKWLRNKHKQAKNQKKQ